MILTVPGDKSVTQRALILAALSQGTSRLSGLLGGADPQSTAGALRALGARVPPIPADGSPIEVTGRGLHGLVRPEGSLDLGNSGTGARLLLGVLAGQPFDAVLTGDESLRSRPMRRVTEPLGLMGASFEEMGEPGRLPLRVAGGALRPLELELPVASAQVKSALLLAGLSGGVSVRLTEPGRSRDHTERMLRAAGVRVPSAAAGPGSRIELLDPPERISAREWQVPGDFSSAAFFLVLALLGGAGPSLEVRDVGLNPTRTGLLGILRRMGARLEVESTRPDDGIGEPLGVLGAAPSGLSATAVEPHEVPEAIDELPILAAAAARARGVTRITGAAELRVKETDRIRALAENLRRVGVTVEELDDGLEIEGTDAPLTGRVPSYGDHRIAMAFGVLGALPGNDVQVEGAHVVDVSYPDFWLDLDRASGGAAGARR
jgi:3-phosphoshikimate 1-carboxyvinyltransferase